MDKGLQRWLRRDGLALIAGWRRWGLDIKEVAGKMGVSVARLKRWADEYEEISVALEIDAAAADFLVEEVVFRRAVEGDQKAAEFWMKHRRDRGNEELEVRFGGKPSPEGNEELKGGVCVASLAGMILGSGQRSLGDES